MIKQLKTKFILINMSIVTVMLLVIFGMVLRTTGADMEQQSIRTLYNLSQGEKFPMSRPGEPVDGVRLPYFYATLDDNGSILSAKGGYFDLTDEESLLEIITAAQKKDENMGVLRSYNLRFLKRAAPFGTLLTFVDISSERAIIRNLVRSCILIGFASFSAFLALSFYLAKWAVRPVENAWNQQRQFVADASHELKTPLTVIMTTAEILASGDYDHSQFPQIIGSILTMAKQMRGLVESLLELARVDNGTSRVAFDFLNLSEVVSDATLPFEPVYFENGLELKSEIEENIWVRGSEAHLKQVVGIFLDNAIKYSTPGGQVKLILKRRDNGCLLSVASPGEEISKENLKRIFNRFYRMDKARTMDHSYGLGLSIAESIVAQHKGKIWAESETGVNTFCVQLSRIEKR